MRNPVRGLNLVIIFPWRLTKGDSIISLDYIFHSVGSILSYLIALTWMMLIFSDRCKNMCVC